MSFKLDAYRDLAEVFLDMDEFADVLTVDGIEMVGVLDESERDDGDRDMGIPAATHVLYVKSDALQRRTPVGGNMVVDGIAYGVSSYREDMGLTTIGLVRYE